MECVTIQSRIVLNKLLSGKEYIADFNNVAGENLLVAYKRMMQEYKYSDCPIFLSPIVPGFKNYMHGANTMKDVVIMKFSIPDEFVKIQIYYDWSDIIYFLETKGEWEDINPHYDFEDYIRNTLSDTITISDTNKYYQITTQILKPEWLIGFAEITVDFVEKYVINANDISKHDFVIKEE